MDKHKHTSKARRSKNKARNSQGSPSRLKAKNSPAGKRPSQESARGSTRGAKRDTGRNARGGDWIYGAHAALAAIANPDRDCRRIVLAETASQDLETRVAEAQKSLSDRPSVERMDRTQLEALLPPASVHQGLAVQVLPLKGITIEDITRDYGDKSDAAVVILDQATDPRNIGAVMRSAAAFGAACVVVQDRNAPAITGVLCKAASGAVESVPYVRVVNLARAIATLKEAGFWATGLDPTAKRTLAEADLSGRVALVLGAEGRGLRRLTRDTCDELLRVPLTRGADSLNLSNAAAVALYELARKRT